MTGVRAPGGPAAGAAVLRSGPGYWLTTYRTLLRWDLATMRLYLPVLAIVQVLAGAGFVLGFGLFFAGSVPPRAALYVATGVPVISLYLLGLVLLPQIIGEQRLRETYDYLQSVPGPRPAGFAAWYTITLLVGVPAMVISLVVAVLRFDVPLTVSAEIVPATMLVTLTATAIGYAIGHAITLPMAANVLVQALNFFVIGFAPVCLPPQQLPSWLVTLNRGLPFESMAVVMRSSLTAGGTGGTLRAYLLLAAWAAGCLALSAWAVGRRG